MPVPRADLTKYNEARKVRYQPKKWHEKTARELVGATTPTYHARDWLRNLFGKPALREGEPIVRLTGDTRADYWQQFTQGRIGEPQTWQAFQNWADQFTGQRPQAAYQPPEPEVDQYGRPIEQVDPELLEYVMSHPPGHRVTFNPSIPRAGDEFVNYLMEEGVVPFFNTQGILGAPRPGFWTSYLMNRLGIYQSGVNPYAGPPRQTTQQASYSGRGYGGYGSGGYGGYGYSPYTPEPPKQYGTTRNVTGYNPQEWLAELVVWNI
jgi:hypothetical protein